MRCWITVGYCRVPHSVNQTQLRLSQTVKINPEQSKQYKILPNICFRRVIRPISRLRPTENDSLADGRLQRNTAKGLCHPETNADVLLDIMERFDMLILYKAKPRSSETRVQEYLVPCMMKRVPQGKVGQKDHNVPILFFKFEHRHFIEKGKRKDSSYLTACFTE